MLKYLVIQLCDSAHSFCHYPESNKESKLISIEDLKDGILFAMKENLNIQFVYPDYKLSEEYKTVIDEIDHVDIVSSDNKDSELLENAEIVILNSWNELGDNLQKDKSYVLRTDKKNLFENYRRLKEVLPKVERLNIVLTDIPEFKEEDFERYKEILTEIGDFVAKEYINEKTPQTNILTDRFVLTAMNNCNAGDEVVTLAPDGKFYICPAFYLQESKPEGDLKDGLQIRNPQLFKLEYAPICRKCDAYQCKRCVWLNELQTLEVNTPGHEQCVVSHLERNESRKILNEIRKHGVFMPEIEINELDYLDPFEIVNKWK